MVGRLHNPRKDRFLRACRLEPVDATPVWLMRQAGRSLPDYRRLRTKYSFLELMRNADLCARVTLMPLKAMEVDAAIIFADIMTPVAGLGVDYEMVEGVGPVLSEPIASLKQIQALPQIPVGDALPELFEAIKIVRGEVENLVPLIGFAGAPFTLASYLIEGRPTRDFSRTKAMMANDPQSWTALMDRLTAVLVEYLQQQVHSGVQAFQLFDSWVGELTREEYELYVLPFSRKIFAETSMLGVPRIHFGTGTSGFLDHMAATGTEVVGVDWRIPLDEAWLRIGHDRAIQGNLDPKVLLEPAGSVEEATKDILARAEGRPGHIFNLGHGVLPDSPLENLKLLIDAVHQGV